MNALDTDPQRTAAALRAVLEQAAEQATKLAEIVGRALETGALETGALETGALETGALETGALEPGDRESSALVGGAFPTSASAHEREGPARLRALTPREAGVLQLVLEGLSSKEIARKLGISRATARCHIQNILTKLGVYSRGQAAVLAAGRPTRLAVAPGLATLTPRETEVLRALTAGLDRREIAERLFVSPDTVRTHIQRVLAKLGVHSVLGAMAVARSAGLGPPQPCLSR